MTDSPSTRFSPNASGWLHYGNAYVAMLTDVCARDLGLRRILRIDDLMRQYRSNTGDLIAEIQEDMDYLGVEYDATTLASFYTCHTPRSVRVDGADRLLMTRDCQGVDVAMDAFRGGIVASRNMYDLAPLGVVNNLVCDDITDNVTLVVRDEAFVPGMVGQMALYHHYGARPPVYAHIPFLCNEDGAKMSKSGWASRGMRFVRDLRRNGIYRGDAQGMIMGFYQDQTGCDFQAQRAKIVQAYIAWQGHRGDT